MQKKQHHPKNLTSSVNSAVETKQGVAIFSVAIQQRGLKIFHHIATINTLLMLFYGAEQKEANIQL